MRSPKSSLAAIKSAPYVWISHGHPDHLSPASLDGLRGKTILLPDHVGNRIHASLVDLGHTCQILPDRKWVRLGDRTRIMCIADYNQDAVLLVDINARLAFNRNHAQNSGWRGFVRRLL